MTVSFGVITILLLLSMIQCMYLGSHIDRLENRVELLESKLKAVNSTENDMQSLHQVLDSTVDVHYLEDNTTTNDQLVSEIVDMRGYMKLNCFISRVMLVIH